MKPIIRINACCNTDPGLVRLKNEDTCLVNNEDGFFLIADGMGSSIAGKMAGVLFRETVVENISINSKRSVEVTKDLVEVCFHTANSKILSNVVEIPAHSGMGCTAELMVFHDSGFVLGHVGDSRTYRMRSGRLEQLTNDHTFVRELQDQGLIPRGQDRSHPMRNIILRAVGKSEHLEVDIMHGTVLPDDIFLLCTDGLSDMMKDEEIKEILSFEWPLAVKATMLIDQANYNGGKDNITVALIEVK